MRPGSGGSVRIEDAAVTRTHEQIGAGAVAARVVGEVADGAGQTVAEEGFVEAVRAAVDVGEEAPGRVLARAVELKGNRPAGDALRQRGGGAGDGFDAEQDDVGAVLQAQAAVVGDAGHAVRPGAERLGRCGPAQREEQHRPRHRRQQDEPRRGGDEVTQPRRPRGAGRDRAGDRVGQGLPMKRRESPGLPSTSGFQEQIVEYRLTIITVRAEVA